MVDPAAIAAGADVDHAYFKKTAWPGRIEGEQGLSFIEPWGVWSMGEKVAFDFSQALPARFELRLRAHAFAGNAGKDFVARVAGQSVRFQLGASDEDRVLEFSNPAGARTLTIDVPSPVSPQELGMGKDDRRLGIGFAEIRIVPL